MRLGKVEESRIGKLEFYSTLVERFSTLVEKLSTERRGYQREFPLETAFYAYLSTTYQRPLCRAGSRDTFASIMLEQTLFRHARLYKRYMDAIAAAGENAKYFPHYYFVGQAADREYSLLSAQRIISDIRKDPDLLHRIEQIIKEL